MTSNYVCSGLLIITIIIGSKAIHLEDAAAKSRVELMWKQHREF